MIYLMNGDHGNVDVSGDINQEFITVQAVPGQVPLLRSLRLNGASTWHFDGLKVQGAFNGTAGALPGIAPVMIGRSPWRGPSDNIIFANGSVSTEDDASRWTDLDWLNKAFQNIANFLAGSGSHLGN